MLTREEIARSLATTLSVLAREHTAIVVATVFLRDGGLFTIVTPSFGDTDEERAKNERAALMLTRATIEGTLAGQYESAERGFVTEG